MKAICVGHSTFDTTLPIEEYPIENKKYRIKNHIECGGGPASNGAYLLAKWGLDTTIASIVGNDYYGDKVVEDFKKVHADTSFLEQRENYMTTSSYIIANMSNGSRTILTSKQPPIRKLNKTVDLKADAILIDGEHPETALEVLENNPQAISVLDAGRLTDDTRILGKKVTYVACSKDFAEEFTNQKIDYQDLSNLKDIHQIIEDYYQTNIIITLEDKGAFTKINDNYELIPSIKVKALDSTGAGDIFHGALTFFLANQYSIKEAIRYACITGAISVTRIGSRNSIPTLHEVLDYDNVI